MAWIKEIRQLLEEVKWCKYNAKHTDCNTFRDYMNVMCIRHLTLIAELLRLDVLDYSKYYRLPMLRLNNVEL